MTIRRAALGAGVAASAIAAGAADVRAGAFQLNERSTKALGTALAGSVSAASDVSFAGFNPAALSGVGTAEIAGNLSAVLPRTDGEIVTGPAAGFGFESGQGAPVGSFAAGYRVNDALVVGLVTHAPFGLETAHPDGFPGAADATTSKLLSLQVSPTVAWEPVDGLTFGAAADILYVDVTLKSAVTELEGEDIAAGFSAGILWEPTGTTNVGIAYHTGFDLETDGDQFNRLLGGVSAPLTARASLPGMLQVGITQGVTGDLRVMAEGRFIDWSVFDSLDFSSPGLAGTPFADFSEEQQYEDAFLVAAGAEYDIDQALTLRGGVAYDDTPTTDAFRTVRVPDGDRMWLSLGASYALSERMTVDLAYNYLRVLDDVAVTLRNGALAGSRLDYEGDVHIVSIGGSVRF